ncbi:MAG TPA: FAD-linked oxidase C-terminal domain-containing protein [Streptosporangiaceae bacterium]
MVQSSRRTGASDLEAALAAAVAGEVRFDGYTRTLYSRDASMYAIEPIGVVFPRDADDVAAVVSVATECAVPVLPRGAGTSLAGQTVGAAVIMDFSAHMDRILEIDPQAMTARVQPGTVQQQLNVAASAHGLMFGPDTSTANRATIGGMIGNNSAGSHSVRYGMTIDHVRELDVVLSDASLATFGAVTRERQASLASAATLEGALYRELPAIASRYGDAIAAGYPRLWRQSGGYRLDWLGGDGRPAPGRQGRPAWPGLVPDAATRPGSPGPDGLDLAKFVTGSEGTLVTVTQATVGLVRAPRHRVIAVGHFGSVQAAIEATEPALECGPAAVELMDRIILDLSRSKREYRDLGSILHGDPEALLFVTFFGESLAEATAGLDRLEAAWRRGGHGYHTLRATSQQEQGALLKVREAGLGLLMASSAGSRRPLAFVEDTAVEPARLAAYARRLREILQAHDLTAGFYGHASVGCLHVRPFVDLARPGQRAAMRAVAGQVRELVAEFGGVNSSEHGDGLARSEFNEAMFGPDLYQAMREVKRLFDPDGRMNPGKIVDALPMTEHLREPPSPAGSLPVTRLSFGPAGGMLGAADRCMNIGLCRKTHAGVMCPSYMATRQEEHSTRGRANALIKALTDPDPVAALGGERLHEILDLCLECKACKSECPLGVDMAALKSETLAAYHDRHGIPLRSRVFGSIRTLNRLGSAVAPLANSLAALAPLRRAGQRWLGVTAARPLPRFDRQNVFRWFAARRQPAVAPAGKGELTFLADSFTSYTEPGVARAVIELLELAGWRVRLTDAGCCGRAGISKGLLDRARGQASRVTAALAGPVSAGQPVTGAEPSCLLTLQDEYLAMLPDDDRAAALAAATVLPEELLLAAVADGRLVIPADNPLAGKRIVVHGHCHQKAITGMSATVGLLRAIPGAEVIELDAGCCGMAGSFGFESEHYDLSMRIGELRLFPAIRAEPPDTVIAATGVSCRQQIRHGTGRVAWHPAQVITQAAVGTRG